MMEPQVQEYHGVVSQGNKDEEYLIKSLLYCIECFNLHIAGAARAESTIVRMKRVDASSMASTRVMLCLAIMDKSPSKV